MEDRLNMDQYLYWKKNDMIVGVLNHMDHCISFTNADPLDSDNITLMFFSPSSGV